MVAVDYILGHADAELRRLMLQASILRPVTERLLREAGLCPGMRVLDIGSGTGDVAMLAAEIVGPTGSVVGVDRSAETLVLARERADEAGHRNIEFLPGAAESLSLAAEFDFAIGRFVLIHQADPAVLIRAAASRVRPGGVVAFHEPALFGEGLAMPPVPLWAETWAHIVAAFASVMPHPDAGGRMVSHFQRAGLRPPNMFAEVPIGVGREAPIYGVIAQLLRNVLPQLEKIGAATPDIDIDTLEERLGEAVAGAGAQMFGPTQFCGWGHRSAGSSLYAR